MDKPYFVILDGQNGEVMPLMENEFELAMFGTELDAKEAGFKCSAGTSFNFEVFELGGGVYIK